MKKQIMALFLAIALIFGMLPTVAFAENSVAPAYLAAFVADVSVALQLAGRRSIAPNTLSRGKGGP